MPDIPIPWPVLLMAIGCILAVLEVFIPSGGILGFLASTAVLTSIVMAFYESGPATGFAFAAVAVVFIPVLLAAALKYWPQTPMGRKFLLGGLPTDEETLPDDDQRRLLRSLVGRFGQAKTPMLPAGAVEVDGHVIDAISQGMPIDVGQRVKVVEARANRVVVRPLRENEREHAQQPDDALSRPLDELGIDPLDDPLG